MSPRLTAVVGYRFVRPEDVNPETDEVITSRARCEDITQIIVTGIKEVRSATLSVRRTALDDVQERDRLLRLANDFERFVQDAEDSVPTAERTVCVWRETKP